MVSQNQGPRPWLSRKALAVQAQGLASIWAPLPPDLLTGVAPALQRPAPAHSPAGPAQQKAQQGSNGPTSPGGPFSLQQPGSQQALPPLQQSPAAASPAMRSPEVRRPSERSSAGHLDAAAAARLSGSPLLGSLLTALRRSRSPASAAGRRSAERGCAVPLPPPADTCVVSARPGGRGSGPSSANTASAAAAGLASSPSAAAAVAASHAMDSPDVASLVVAALAAQAAARISGSGPRPRRLSPQTPEAKPSKSQGSDRRP